MLRKAYRGFTEVLSRGLRAGAIAFQSDRRQLNDQIVSAIATADHKAFHNAMLWLPAASALVSSKEFQGNRDEIGMPVAGSE